jgi:hypothetical protein
MQGERGGWKRNEQSWIASVESSCRIVRVSGCRDKSPDICTGLQTEPSSAVQEFSFRARGVLDQDASLTPQDTQIAHRSSTRVTTRNQEARHVRHLEAECVDGFTTKRVLSIAG